MAQSDTQRIEDFIFVRELNEVFLLLDHISGRWDKSLYASGVVDDGSPHIDELVAIGLTPAGSDTDRVAQAVKLLQAKDRLNAAARPATGLTIAFTLLVVGEDNSHDWTSWLRRLTRPAHAATPPAPDRPTRLTLARYAFPGLVRIAARFKLRILAMVLLLILHLVLTCMMSWHVMGGNVILQHIDALKAQQAAVIRSISEAELKFAADEKTLVRFCTGANSGSYRNTEEYQLCTRRGQIENQLQAVRSNLRIWLQPWKACYGWASGWLAAPPVRGGSEDVQRRGTEELARIVTMVVGTAVLPLCYGILGAGAAVVRGLWAKMRESMLSPRDYTLALLQLALGATIGACIALFINPSGQAAGSEIGLLGNWALSSSALSFIAGFGVEGVFLALESFVRRVFNITETRTVAH